MFCLKLNRKGALTPLPFSSYDLNDYSLSFKVIPAVLCTQQEEKRGSRDLYQAAL